MDGPVAIYLTDDRNRSVGFHPQAAAYVSQIPGAKYTAAAGQQTLVVPNPRESYELVARGEGDGGSFGITLEGLVNGQPVAVRSSGLARSLGAEQITSSIKSGELLGTSFTFRDGGIRDLRRPPEALRSAQPKQCRVRVNTVFRQAAHDGAGRPGGERGVGGGVSRDG